MIKNTHKKRLKMILMNLINKTEINAESLQISLRNANNFAAKENTIESRLVHRLLLPLIEQVLKIESELSKIVKSLK